MYVAPVDSEVICTDEMDELKEQYERTFGKRFIPFNYCDFQRNGDKCAAQIYKEEIERCLREGKPTSIVSKWCQPGNLIDH